MQALKWGVAAVLAGVAVYAIATGKLDNINDGKFLGFIPENEGFGVDDIAKGGIVLGAAWLGGMLVHKMGGPASVVRPA